ncbi:hypothetical protein F5X99DRAFT_430416 [Biscogniauxia marginata]|nr:hypothetical protein F5X99DRAFT_430416 [Biscogniauxia marginata]
MATTIIYPPQDAQPPSLPRLAPASNGKGDSPKSPNHFEKDLSHRLLSHAEWSQFCRGVGVLKDDESDQVVRPTSRWWPPAGFKDGLYQDVLFEKTKFSYWFHLVNAAQWILMLSQLALGAVLTAIGSISHQDGPRITIIAAVQTCISGILALIHNSGLPYRYRSDRNEFYKLEEHLKSIIDTALVPADKSIHEVLADCFDMFRAARQTVQDNIPASYKSSTSNPAQPPRPIQGLQKIISKK